MNSALYDATEFTKVKQNVIDRCISDYAKERLENKQPAISYNMVQKRLTETQEALAILNSNQHVPFMGLSQIKYLTKKIENGAILEASELTEYSDFLRSFHLIAAFFEKNQYQTPTLFRYANDLTEFKKIITTIQEKVDGNRVKDEASRELKKIRGKTADIQATIEKSCDKLLKKATANGWVQERL
ncbi:MAG: endonuclease MutS2, partial [Tetragenococcus halophilus]|nr:endonuclease MutS2 [Tetragenococcus halophilus]